MFLKLKYCCMWRSLKCFLEIFKEVFQKFSKFWRDVVPSRCSRWLEALLKPCLCRVGLSGFVFGSRFFLSDFYQDLTPVFVPPVPFSCVRIVPRSQFGVIRLLSFMGSFEYFRVNGVHCESWILNWFDSLRVVQCELRHGYYSVDFLELLL